MIQLTSIFKYVHTAKRTHNDLKFENVMINTQGKLDADPQIFLIDFGFADKFMEKDGKTHINPNANVEMFQGNMLFSSVRQMEFRKTSRKDDLIALFYLMIYSLNDEVLFVGKENPMEESHANINVVFNAIKNWKVKHDLGIIAELFAKQFEFPIKPKDDQEKHINDFYLNICLTAHEIEKIGFADKPAYTKIKSLLTKSKTAVQKLL